MSYWNKTNSSAQTKHYKSSISLFSRSKCFDLAFIPSKISTVLKYHLNFILFSVKNLNILTPIVSYHPLFTHSHNHVPGGVFWMRQEHSTAPRSSLPVFILPSLAAPSFNNCAHPLPAFCCKIFKSLTICIVCTEHVPLFKLRTFNRNEHLKMSRAQSLWENFIVNNIRRKSRVADDNGGGGGGRQRQRCS